jgi:hypothetical protein
MQCFDIGNAVLWAYAKYRKVEMREELGTLGKFGEKEFCFPIFLKIDNSV